MWKIVRMRRVIFCLLCLILCLSVGAQGKKKKGKAKKEPTKEQLTPSEAKIPEEQVTRVTCKVTRDAKKISSITIPSEVSFDDDDWYNYHVYLPKGYHANTKKGREYPFIVIDSPSGNGQKQFAKFKQWAQENSFILIMLVEARNYGDDAGYKATLGCYIATMYDIKKRFSLAKKSGITTGSSGGSRRATFYGAAYSDMIGGVLNSGGATASGSISYQSKNHIFAAAYCGDVCFNVGEVSDVANAMKGRGHYGVYAGGHSWVKKHLIHEGLDWLMYKMSMRRDDRIHKDSVSSYILARLRAAKESKYDVVKKETYELILEILNARTDVEYSPRFQKLPRYLRGQLANLSRKSNASKEADGKELFDKYYREYCVLAHCGAVRSKFNYSYARTEAQKVGRLIEKSRKEAVAKMTEIKTNFSGTYAAEMAEKELVRLESLKARVLKSGH